MMSCATLAQRPQEQWGLHTVHRLVVTCYSRLPHRSSNTRMTLDRQTDTDTLDVERVSGVWRASLCRCGLDTCAHGSRLRLQVRGGIAPIRFTAFHPCQSCNARTAGICNHGGIK